LLCQLARDSIFYNAFLLFGFPRFLCTLDYGSGRKRHSMGVYFPLFIILALFGVYGFIAINHNEFVITNKRIIIKSGIIRRASYELRLDVLESIQIYQGIFGRMLNYGTILVHGVGASRQSVMWIESPLEFRQHIFKELNNN
jgi:uncharacterized membrane protein YdbT with pleckstrin-like domain